jgi:hypothetical protein
VALPVASALDQVPVVGIPTLRIPTEIPPRGAGSATVKVTPPSSVSFAYIV